MRLVIKAKYCSNRYRISSIEIILVAHLNEMARHNPRQMA